MKSLLVVAAMLVGSSSTWADPTTVYTKALSDWSNDDITNVENTVNKWYHSGGVSSNVNWTGLTASTTSGLKVCASASSGNGAQYVPAVLTTSHTANTIVTLDAVWNIGTTSSDSNTPYNTFTFGALNIRQNVRSNNLTTTCTINGTTVKSIADAFARDDDMTIHIKVNSSNREISEFYIKNGEKVVAQFSDLNASTNVFQAGSTYNTVTVTANSPTAGSQRTYCFVESLTITEEALALETENVILKYEDTEGNSLDAYKADQILEDIPVGTSIEDLIVAPYTNTFFNGTSNKFVYAGEYSVTGNYTEVQDGGNTIVLKFTNYPTTAYTVKAQKDAEDIKTLASGTAFFDGSTRVAINKYFKEGTKWYSTDETTLEFAITSATNNIAYTEISNIDYFFEVEDLTLVGTIVDGNGTERSGGKAYRFQKNSRAYTPVLEGGTYTVKIYTYGTNGKNPTCPLYYCDNDGSNLVYIGESTATKGNEWGLKETENIVIPDGKSLCLYNNDASNNSNFLMDYIILERTGDPTFAVATINPTYGMATFSSTYALDFTGITTLTAYQATACDGTKVTLEPVTGVVAAGTGLLVQGETTNIPVSNETGTTYSASDCHFYACDGSWNEVTPAASGQTNLVLSVQDEKVVFAPVISVNAPIKAGQAALWVNQSISSARSLNIVFGDESTGISTLDTTKAFNGQTYNLSGQRVAQPTKGLYIVNGKKVIIK